MSDTITNNPQPSSPISAARLAANRQNAQSSTGPTSFIGRKTVSLNALKTALTGVTVLMPDDDRIRYRKHLDEYTEQFTPVGPEERALVQSIADIRWRLNRIPALELTILSFGEFSATNEKPGNYNPDTAPLREIFTRRDFEKDLKNLHLQEHRLSRRREREMAELLRLQAARKQNEAEALAQAAKATLLAQHRKQIVPVRTRVGFEFSKSAFDRYFSRLTPVQKQKLLADALSEEPNPAETVEAAA